MNVRPDKHDLKILTLLQRDARISASEISRKIHLSQTSVAERIRRLEVSSMILGYRTIINHTAFGYEVMAMIKITGQSSTAYISFAITQPEIIVCFSVIGENGIMMRVLATDIAHLQRLIAKISQFGTTSTTIVLPMQLTEKIIGLPAA